MCIDVVVRNTILKTSCRMWASKKYVDSQKIGIWGWVSHFAFLDVPILANIMIVIWWIYEFEGCGG